MSKTNLISASHTHETVPTQFINVKGTKFAYRAFGTSEGVPIVFLQHFTGTLDNWDPAVTNELAKKHPIILFDNKGVGSSEGITPESVAEMANDAIDFINALGTGKGGSVRFFPGWFHSAKSGRKISSTGKKSDPGRYQCKRRRRYHRAFNGDKQWHGGWSRKNFTKYFFY